MSLPLAAIERLFDRLAMTYGNEFKNKWSGMPVAEVKASWAHELLAFSGNLKAIGWALENLPEKCPNLVEFKNLCRQAPKPQNPALSAPKADSSVVDAELMKIVSSVFKTPANETVDHKRWAKRLKARQEAGDKLSPIQVRFYREALEIDS